MRFILFCLMFGCSGCSALDQYVTRTAASHERALTAARTERASRTHVASSGAAHVRTINTCEVERCLEGPPGRVCVHGLRDEDEDGDPPTSCGGHDCDDHDPLVRSEICDTHDGVDNDCDGTVDEPSGPHDVCRSPVL